jgi:hypothetical protein
MAVGKFPKPYDLLWPISKPPKPAKNSGVKAAEVATLTKSMDQGHGSPGKRSIPFMRRWVFTARLPGRYSCGSFSELQDYARKLSAVLTESDATEESVKQLVPREIDQELDREEGGLTGCREAVELLTRNPKKGVCQLQCNIRAKGSIGVYESLLRCEQGWGKCGCSYVYKISVPARRDGTGGD